MGKIIINPYWLDVPLGPLTGLADDDEAVAHYGSLDSDDETAVRMVIHSLICSYVARVDADSLRRIKDAYRFYLSKDDARWDRIFNSLLPPFDHPPRARDFFLWVWQECFPNEEWRIDDPTRYRVRPTVDEIHRTLRLAPE